MRETYIRIGLASFIAWFTLLVARPEWAMLTLIPTVVLWWYLGRQTVRLIEGD